MDWPPASPRQVAVGQRDRAASRIDPIVAADRAATACRRRSTRSAARRPPGADRARPAAHRRSARYRPRVRRPSRSRSTRTPAGRTARERRDDAMAAPWRESTATGPEAKSRMDGAGADAGRGTVIVAPRRYARSPLRGRPSATMSTRRLTGNAQGGNMGRALADRCADTRRVRRSGCRERPQRPPIRPAETAHADDGQTSATTVETIPSSAPPSPSPSWPSRRRSTSPDWRAGPRDRRWSPTARPDPP